MIANAVGEVALVDEPEQLPSLASEAKRPPDQHLSAQWQGNPRNDVPSASSSPWPLLRGGAGACFSRCYAAFSCGTIPRSGPPAALPRAGVASTAPFASEFSWFIALRALPFDKINKHVYISATSPNLRGYIFFKCQVKAEEHVGGIPPHVIHK
jgi:hypothetical protein